MHMADALLSPAVGGTMWAATAVTVAYCSRRLRHEADDRRVPLMGVLGAFLFAAQMINFSIPGTGSSGHLGGGLCGRSGSGFGRSGCFGSGLGCSSFTLAGFDGLAFGTQLFFTLAALVFELGLLLAQGLGLLLGFEFAALEVGLFERRLGLLFETAGGRVVALDEGALLAHFDLDGAGFA